MRLEPEQLTVGVDYFRRNAPGLLSKVENGLAELTLTTHGRVLARVVAPPSESTVAADKADRAGEDLLLELAREQRAAP